MTRAGQPGGVGDEAAWVLAALENVSDDATIVTAPDGTIRSWSRSAERLYGYPCHEAIGRHIQLIVPVDHEDDMACSRSLLDVGEAVSIFETVRRTKAGVEINVASRMSGIFNSEGELIGAVVVDHDLTEQRWLAVTLDATLSSLEGAADEARAAEGRGRRFLADAAHQLRSPIASIQVCAETLLQGVDAAERDSVLNDLVRQTARAGRLLGSLLRIARLDAGEELLREPCDLLALCREEAGRVWYLAPHLDITLRAPDQPDDTPKLDADAVREILANLLENAIRYAVSEVSIEVSTSDETVEIRVGDDGPGLPAGMEERVFERFVTLGPKSGSGLGLPIALELARAHGGGLTYEGRCFMVRLPRG
ncbi:MAG TPA: PAS domain-containing sensor histidine kinase [Acidimicrobiales bacterium]|nr:PAS domain-containing sensor histidine kinase [Acidimicrobiales bacterium]